MKSTLKIITVLFISLLVSCGGKEEKKEETFSYQKKATTEKKEEAPKVETVKASEKIDLTNKGVGPIKSVELPADIDQSMATKGEDIYKKMCTACHRVDKKFIGPAPTGILERRTPEWIMNMILNPEEMVQNDPLAKELLIEFNGSPMANQNLTEDEARAVLEYFRTLK
ncbi:c-type cytochrome [Xanthomarina gelatinilytica]|uniref:c-type cytochrome n=1 Tax=Xanthomarina gelatinilytica TaxID=1137281 RepID=UPI003AA7E631